jgi:hypothetical protein
MKKASPFMIHLFMFMIGGAIITVLLTIIIFTVVRNDLQSIKNAPTPTPWVTLVPSATPTVPPDIGSCQVVNCHGLDVQCGLIDKPGACTAVLTEGDVCRQYASCEQQGNTCTTVYSERYATCKACVQKCKQQTKNDPMRYFECESINCR